jgi:hypothetical protein
VALYTRIHRLEDKEIGPLLAAVQRQSHPIDTYNIIHSEVRGLGRKRMLLKALPQLTPGEIEKHFEICNYSC